MASILDRFGIKEVFDLWFYEINDDGKKGKPILYIDTAKTSSVEQTAETTEARGGKGNAVLVSWDHSKEVTINITDALFSQKSFATLFANGTVDAPDGMTITKLATARITTSGQGPTHFVADVYDATEGGSVRKNIYFGSTAPSGLPNTQQYDHAAGKLVISKMYTEQGKVLGVNGNGNAFPINESDAQKLVAGEKIFIEYQVHGYGSTLAITADSFPGTYYVVGNTYARSDVSGKDQFFQVIFPKAKMQAENTLELSADGDPAVANMNLKLMRPDDGVMMKVLQYDLDGSTVSVG